MKRVFLLFLVSFYCVMIKAQMSGTLFGTPYSFSKPTMSGGGGGGGNNNNWHSTSTSTVTAPSSGEVLNNAYKQKAAEKYTKGVAAWNRRDWDQAIRLFNDAIAFNNSQTYQDALQKAKGYREWDKGVELATKEHWQDAISRYQKALEYFPDNNTLKNNIIGCSYNQVLELADKYYKNEDWINAAVYYNVLWKNFGYDNYTAQSRYSEAYTKINGMKKADKALSKFNAKLEDIKKGLPFVSDNW